MRARPRLLLAEQFRAEKIVHDLRQPLLERRPEILHDRRCGRRILPRSQHRRHAPIDICRNVTSSA